MGSFSAGDKTYNLWLLVVKNSFFIYINRSLKIILYGFRASNNKYKKYI